MTARRLMSVVILTLFAVPTALASSTWYVDGVHGSDNNDCKSPQTGCKTIVHAISLASSGDFIMVAAATYTENLTIGFNLTLTGSGATTTIIDGGKRNTVVTISSASAHVALANATIRNGSAANGGGIINAGTLTVNNSTITGNQANVGGGINNSGALTINNSTLSSNLASPLNRRRSGAGGIYNGGTAAINNSTLSGNTAGGGGSVGGGILSQGTLTLNNSTLSGNGAAFGGGMYSHATLTLSNSIVANSSYGGNCLGSLSSKGYNLSSDGTCNFKSTGDLNNTDPKLGTLGNYGGPTQTIPLLSGSPAIDAGNPSGCKDGQGHLLTADQRSQPRPDKEDSGGCDMGAYESQKD